MQNQYYRQWINTMVLRSTRKMCRTYTRCVTVVACIFVLGILGNISVEIKFRGRKFRLWSNGDAQDIAEDGSSKQSAYDLQKRADMLPNDVPLYSKEKWRSIEENEKNDFDGVKEDSLPRKEEIHRTNLPPPITGNFQTRKKIRWKTRPTTTEGEVQTPSLLVDVSTKGLSKLTTVLPVSISQAQNVEHSNGPHSIALKMSSHRSTVVTAPQTSLPPIAKANMKALPKKEEKTVLMFTTLFDQPRWPDLNDQQIVDYPQRAKCLNANLCKLTYDKEAIDYAAAVIFHGVDLMNRPEFTVTKLQPYIHRRPSHQRWIFFMHESPANYNKFQPYRNLFNWTMTYEFESELFIPYSHFQPLSEQQRAALPPVKDFSQGRDKLVIWMVSNCGQFREKYVKELQKHVDISIYGKCASTFGSTLTGCKRDTEECLQIIIRHKFFLAFENSFCKDYITEKFWTSLTRYNIVPVVFGANYNIKVVPPGSYIDSYDFPSAKALAEYLSYLDKNNTAYNEYFQWKRKYRIVSYDKICSICDKIHQPDLPPKIYPDIWSYNRSCLEYEAKMKRYESMLRL